MIFLLVYDQLHRCRVYSDEVDRLIVSYLVVSGSLEHSPFNNWYFVGSYPF